MIAEGIIDPAKVTRSALQNAASIAGLFLTTEVVVADKPEKAAPAARVATVAWAAWTSSPRFTAIHHRRPGTHCPGPSALLNVVARGLMAHHGSWVTRLSRFVSDMEPRRAASDDHRRPRAGRFMMMRTSLCSPLLRALVCCAVRVRAATRMRFVGLCRSTVARS